MIPLINFRLICIALIIVSLTGGFSYFRYVINQNNLLSEQIELSNVYIDKLNKKSKIDDINKNQINKLQQEVEDETEQDEDIRNITIINTLNKLNKLRTEKVKTRTHRAL